MGLEHVMGAYVIWKFANKFLVPQMFAEVAQDKRTAEDAGAGLRSHLPGDLPEVAQPEEDLEVPCEPR
jgi:hypothetical protein